MQNSKVIDARDFHMYSITKSVVRQNLLREAVRVVMGHCPMLISKSSDGTDSPIQSSKRTEGACFLHSRSWLLESLTAVVHSHLSSPAVSLQQSFTYTYLRPHLVELSVSFSSIRLDQCSP